MIKPVILTLDDEPQVLNAVARDLRAHFRNDYRIVSASSGKDALDALQQLKQRNTPVALFLADQRMPQMTGVEFLEAAQAFYPDARKVLLTAYADTEAAIASINKVGLESIGDNLFVETAGSGPAIDGLGGEEGFGTLQQNYLEEGNVQAVTELSSLIAAQRAYEMNSKVITAADQMMSATTQMFRG